MEKKDSIFAGLSPASSAPPVAASKPAVSDQELAALKQKIDSMEKNIVAQLERKITEARNPVPPPPPKPPDMGAQFLLSRIGELERKLEEFARGAMMSSAQMKNIEESKVSARREIEELLKVVREQQKYSEMDRQMHDQLEKSWRRVEDLEKKLMDFYASSMNRNAAAPAADLEKILEDKTRQAAEILARRSEEKLASMSGTLDAKLTAFELEFKNMYLNISKLVVGHTGELISQTEKEEARLKKMEAEAEINAQKVRSEISALAVRMEEQIRASSTELGARMQAENARSTAEITKLSGLSAYSLAGAAALVKNLDGLESRLVKLRDAIKTLVDGMKTMKLEALLGVSGDLARKNLTGLCAALLEMERELAFFEERKREIAGNLEIMTHRPEPPGDEGAGKKP